MPNAQSRNRSIPRLGRHFSSQHSVFSITCVVLLNIACSTSQPRDPNVITIAVRSGPNSLDPRLSNDEATQRMA
jgi:hypothetical protein